MKIRKDQDDQFLVSFADLMLLLRKHKKTILNWSLAVGFLGIAFALIHPIRYRAEGTFREKGVKANNMSNTSVIQLLSGAPTGIESEAASLMTSRRILKDVVEKLHLQGNLRLKSDSDTTPKVIKQNLSLVWATTFRRSPQPVLQEISCPLEIKSLSFFGEFPTELRINLLADGLFEVHEGEKSVGKGKLGEPYSTGELSFTLIHSNLKNERAVNSYLLTANPLQNTIKDLHSVLKVEPSKLDKTLLKLNYEHRNRHLASQIVNSIMESYQNYLKDYHAEVAMNQLEYLNQRRDQLTDKLNELMKKHADYLTDDLSNSGFIEASKEIDFLAKSQHEYKQKMLDNELEIKRLTNIKPGSLAYYHRYSNNEGDPAFINSILSDMRSLKQQRDALEIELQKKSAGQGDNLQHSFEQQINELREVQQNIAELRQVTEQFQQERLAENSKIMDDPRFLLKRWFERMQKAQAEGSSNLKETKENFQYYLDNLARSFGVHERILQERLTHQQNPSGEYKGISLEVATNLYLDYSKQHVQNEGAIRQNLFFIRQIEDPNFEITSLSSGLGDEISNNMIRKASELLLNLRDQKNQSTKEQERIKEELNLQRTFLSMHLNQMVHLMGLNNELLDEKIFALENISLELIHQRISLMEQNLHDYLKSRLNNLQQEKILIQRHLDNIHAEMANLPQKWVSEKLLTQEVETNQKIVEEIAKLVESKNISHNLDVIQSSPVDLATPPLHPITTKFFLWGFLGFFLGGCIGSGYILGKAVKTGMPATANNLNLMGFHVSGMIQDPGSFQNKNRETLRRLQTYFDETEMKDIPGAKTALLLEGKGPHYASDLAELFVKRGKRVLILDLNFDDTHKISLPGLLQYLEGSISHLPIRRRKNSDWVDAGGYTSHMIEMVHSPAFLKLMDEIKEQYDWILAFTSTPPVSGEAESLLALFPYAAITLTDEIIDDLTIFVRSQELHSGQMITFMIVE